jgi:AcrR family transcriptional regulator
MIRRIKRWNGGVGSMRADTRATVDDLLNVAEQLFARHGVEQIALTRIVGSSRQRNRSALHYHFGSREGVLKAVLDRRLKHINALRLAALDRPARCNDLARVIRALVEPFCLVALNEPWGADYISILAQVSFHPTLLGESALDDANLSAVRRCKKLVIEALPTIRPATLNRRFRWLTDSVVLAVARWARNGAKSGRAREVMENLIEEFIAYGVAGLAAPQREAKRPRLAAPARRVAR